MSGISQIKSKAKMSFDEMFSESSHANHAIIEAPKVSDIFRLTKSLEPIEEDQIELLLIDSSKAGTTSDVIENDINQIKQITAEIRTIGKQGSILMGERAFKAREILKSYKDGAFTKWLEISFGSKRSGYNALSYYELFISLPDSDIKDKFKKIPQKVAYALASRIGEIEKKAEIINSCDNLKTDQMLELIQEQFPSEKKKQNMKSHPQGKHLIFSAFDAIQKIKALNYELSEQDKQSLCNLKNMIDLLLV
ncbi:CT583 family protein [Candidatus Protochlamydia phocaeensis]|uniref:CT583 family protein n=1 Tax=Candidatus Protochlamydia phocaeensis TaxID=1414722 RepID=UPI000838FD52|nr:CT583 family protein [Candidatus Protochlamydia phocaeensis]